MLLAFYDNWHLFLNQRLERRQSVIPLLRNAIETAAGVIDRANSVSPGANATHHNS
jgi:hypothetical protein